MPFIYPLQIFCAFNIYLHPVRAVLLNSCRVMPIYVRCERRRRVPWFLLNGFDIITILQTKDSIYCAVKHGLSEIYVDRGYPPLQFDLIIVNVSGEVV